MKTINKVAVIGSGLMGSAIAGHIANAGIPVMLLDIVPENASDRNILGKNALSNLLKSKPAPLFNKKVAKLITIGNTEDDLDKIAEVDWVCEAIIENLEIKQDLYKKIEKLLRAGTIISSNTSTIPLKKLVEGRSDSFKSNFMITHFFNPPRYMRLLEVVRSSDTSQETVDSIIDFCDIKLGKDIVECKDRPGFVANRIGIHWMNVAINSAFTHDMTIEEVDSICGRPIGLPKTGIFGLIDLIGIDLSEKVTNSMLSLLPEDDLMNRYYKDGFHAEAVIKKLIEIGNIGRKGKTKAGFYQIRKVDNHKVFESMDLKTMEYRPQKKSKINSAKTKNVNDLLSMNDKGSAYAWQFIKHFSGYAALLVGEVADNIYQIDIAMKNGYGLKFGPFELIDQIGVDTFVERLKEDNFEVAKIFEAAQGRPLYTEDTQYKYFMGLDGQYHPIKPKEGILELADIKRSSDPIAKNSSASIWDIGDGVACLEFHSKMNSIDDNIMNMMKKASNLHKKGFKALVVANDANYFSAGVNIGMALFQANIAMWSVINQLVNEGQRTYLAFKYAPFPVVAAPSGITLAGSCELCLHADAVQAHCETYMGLVEPAIGLLPAWGGCKELMHRHMNNPKRAGGPMPALISVFELISTAHVSSSAAEARDKLFIKPNDDITMNRRRVLFDAKQKALKLAENYTPPTPPVFNLPGPTAESSLKMAVQSFVDSGKASPYDQVVAGKIAQVITGGETDMTEELTEKDILELERSAFLDLIQNKNTLERIEYMLDKGKPLRN